MREDNNHAIVRITGLAKRYGDVAAVKDLSFEVSRGEIFGFLGPNGAGKTTTISMLCGLTKPDQGDIVVNGSSLCSHYHRIVRMFGLCPQNIVVWEMLTCLEQLEFVGEIYGLTKKQASTRGHQLLEELGLLEKRDKLAKTLSGGMLRRLNIALALVHNPPIVILDEPQAGLDPQSRILVRDYLRSLSPRTTIILTTHEMDEAERLADRVAIIDHGQLLVLDTPAKLKSQLGLGDVLEITLQDAGGNISGIMARLPDGVQQKSYKNNVLSIIAVDALGILPGIVKLLDDHAVTIADLRVRGKTLEDVFVSLTGRGLRE